MKNLIVLVLTLSTAFALPSEGVKSRNVVVPAGQPEGRITRGHEATRGQLPYQVGLTIMRHDGKYYSCGGSLLNNEWVLTAAHCTSDLVQVTVNLGSIYRQTGVVTYIVGAENVINHKYYNSRIVVNDIALIKIPYTKYSDTIQPVKLPAISSTYSDYSGDSAIASGWGRTTDSISSSATKLQWARLHVIPNRVCQKNFHITSAHLCTSTVNGVNTCNGDSGGPLVLPASDTLIGVTSFGDESCLKDIPGVFTRVTSYLEWIKHFTGISY